MTENNDWKKKYQKALDELDLKESEWTDLESLLRKTIARLSIAGRGIDKKLDRELKNIQQFSRDKKDTKLALALESLSSIMLVLDTPAPGQSSEAPSIDPQALLVKLLRELELSPDQRDQVVDKGGALLSAIVEGKNQKSIDQQISGLCALLNKALAGPAPVAEPSTEIVFELIRLLDIDAPGREHIEQQFESDKRLDPHQLMELAQILNAQLSAPEPREPSTDSIIATMLERFALIPGSSNSIRKIQKQLAKGIKAEQWPAAVTEVVSSVTETIVKLSQEKSDLEGFIKSVTDQLGQLAVVISQDREDHLSGREDTISLQNLMQQGVTKIENEVRGAEDIEQLKTVFTGNINSIRDSVELFVERANERLAANEVRNKMLTTQVSQMEQETAELQRKLVDNRKKLLHDALTGVKSRLAYDEQMEQEISRWQRYGSPFVFTILDIDHFKRINDQFGHSAGDKALKIIAQLMLQHIRKSDTLFRVGGEEFVLLLTNTTTETAEPLVQKLRDAVAEASFHFKQERVVVTLSAGITQILPDDTAVALYERADAALYRSKNAGRNCQHVG